MKKGVIGEGRETKIRTGMVVHTLTQAPRLGSL